MVYVGTFMTIGHGGGSDSYGVFESKELLKKEYYRIKKALADDVEVCQCYYRKNVEPNVKFKLRNRSLIIINTIKNYPNHNIDYYDEPGEIRQLPCKKDYLLISLHGVCDEEIEYSYIRINKFTCSSECYSQYDRKDFVKHYPNINMRDY